MTNIEVTIIDPKKTRRQKAEIPDDIPMSRLIPALVTKLELPTTDSTGAPQKYKLNHIRTGEMIGDTETFADKGVEDGDELQMSLEIVPGCFLPHTKVFTSLEETKCIEMLRAGDSILSYTPGKGTVQTTKVERVFKETCSSYYVINDVLNVTGSHLVFANDAWRRVCDLKTGDRLKTANAELPITRIEGVEKKSVVYNLEVEHDQTFFAEGYLVHNFSAKQRYEEILANKLESDSDSINETIKTLVELIEKADISSLKRIAITFLFCIYAFLIGGTLVIFFLEGFHLGGFDLSDSLVKWLGAVALGEVAGLVALVYRFLFQERKSKELNASDGSKQKVSLQEDIPIVLIDEPAEEVEIKLNDR